MGLQSSGAISLNEIHIEAGGTSGTQASMNDADIRALIDKNAGATNSFSEYYGASASLNETVSSSTTNLNVSTKFGSSNFTSNTVKVLIINSGVEVGASNLSNYAIIVPSGMGGSLTIQNAGTLSGAGGDGSSSGAGGNGGTALYVASNNVTVTNTGTIRGGGGGGGNGSDGNDGYSGDIAGIWCDGGSGGSGGSGGNGQGYDQSQSNGSSGSAASSPSCDYPNGMNDGTCNYLCQYIGGTWGAGRTAGSDGGNGGTYGNSGSQGGGGGGNGGSAGKYIQLASGISYSLSNSGTLLGNAP